MIHPSTLVRAPETYEITEIKACYPDFERARKILKSLHAQFQRHLLQKDTYVCVNKGRRIIREGTPLHGSSGIENCIIECDEGMRDGFLRSQHPPEYKHDPTDRVKQTMRERYGVQTCVVKDREVWELDEPHNIIFHLDIVEGLADRFLEMEFRWKPGMSERIQHRAINHYLGMFGIEGSDLRFKSYQDMLLK